METPNNRPGKTIGTRVKSLGKEFRDFAMRGSFLELAIGIAVGTAFNKVVTSFVQDVLMPPIGLLIGRVDFSNLFFSLSGTHYQTLADAQKAGAVTINYGAFLNSIINFLIIALAVFIVVKQVNFIARRDAKRDSLEHAQKECAYCTMQIPVQARRCPHCTSLLEGRS